MIVDERISGYLRALEPDQPEYLARLEEQAIREEVPIIRKDAQALLRFLLRMRRPMRLLEVGTAVGYSCMYMSEYMPEGALIATVEKVPMRLRPAKENLQNAPRVEQIALLVGDAAEVLAKLADGGVKAEPGGKLLRGPAEESIERPEEHADTTGTDIPAEVRAGNLTEAVGGAEQDLPAEDRLDGTKAAREGNPAKPEGLQEIYLPAGEHSAWLGQSFSEPYDLIFLDAAKGQYMNFLPDLLRLLRPDGIFVTDNVLQEGSIAESKFTIVRRDRTIHKRMREYLYELTHREELNTVVLPVGDGMAVTTFRN